MDLNRQQAFFQALEGQIEALGLQKNWVTGSGTPQLGDTLRILVPVTDQGDVVLMELMAVALNEETELLQFYTTMVMEIGPGYEQLEQKLVEWNFLCPVGAFGIFTEGRQFYHKYTIPLFREIDAETLAEQTISVLELIYEVISAKFPQVVQLSGDV